MWMVILLSNRPKKQTLIKSLLTILPPHLALQGICPFTLNCTSLPALTSKSFPPWFSFPNSTLVRTELGNSPWPSRWAQSNFVWGVSWTCLKFEIHSYLDLNFEDPEIGSFHNRIKTHQSRNYWFGLATLAGRITLLNSSGLWTQSLEKSLHKCLLSVPRVTGESVRLNQCNLSPPLKKQIKACPSEYHPSFNS